MLLVERAGTTLPDGLFCANDLLALGVIQSLTMLHTLRIPEDVALVGYDDIDFAVSAVVPLTSISQPTALIGRTAIELLSEQMENPDAGRARWSSNRSWSSGPAPDPRQNSKQPTTHLGRNRQEGH